MGVPPTCSPVGASLVGLASGTHVALQAAAWSSRCARNRLSGHPQEPEQWEGGLLSLLVRGLIRTSPFHDSPTFSRAHSFTET